MDLESSWIDYFPLHYNRSGTRAGPSKGSYRKLLVINRDSYRKILVKGSAERLLFRNDCNEAESSDCFSIHLAVTCLIRVGRMGGWEVPES